MAHNCENCSFRSYAERRPNSILARLWRWHTGWCPGYKAYQRDLAAKSGEKEGQGGEASAASDQ